MRPGPETLKEARNYRYGKWAGYPSGHAYSEGYCIMEIVPNERGALPRQCCNRGVPYCAIHRPGAKEERAAKRPPTRFEREMAAIDKRAAAQREARRHFRALKAIAALACLCCEVDTCPHGIAKKALG